MDWTTQPRSTTLVGPTGRAVRRDRPADDVAGAPAEDRAPRVLLVTRQLQLRAIGATVLQAAGLVVKAESRGEAVVAAVEAWQPDLILSEPELDDMDAARLCSRVRALTAGETVPILVISDPLHSPAIGNLVSEEFTDFIPAPVNWKLLTFRVHRWISLARKFRALCERELDLEQVRDSALKASTELLQLRNYDPVTGLPNREMFVSMVGLAVSQRQRSSGYPTVLFLDLDDFKGVNDLIGRSLGDELLRIVAKRLQRCLREGDLVSQAGDRGSLASFARLNVDQFAILLSGVKGRQAALVVARRLLESLTRPLTIGDRQFRLTARVGIADASDLDGGGENGDGEEILVQRAEIAMRYCKRRRGQTCAFFESFMNESVVKKVELKAELRQALDREQLLFCYQFLVDSRTSMPTGVEALVRWQHPSRGLVSPGEFLPVAEDSDLIVEIDRWVLRNGCRQCKEWLDQGYPPLLMSLNISMRFLEERDFAEQVLAIVDETGLPPSYLQLELSERGALPDAGRIMAQFEMLVARGVQLALDDFGTGQTSLSYLRTLPITCVKVDRSFVSRVPDDSASAAIVTAIAAMSKHLGIKLVAEGVETAEHSRFLSEKGYDELQGFLFSRPERAEVLVKTLRHLRTGRLAEPETAARAAERWVMARGGGAVGRARQLPAGSPADAAASARVPGAGAEGWNSSEDYLLQLARSDFLTKLYNRFSFDERLEHAVAHADRFGHKVALLLIDLDDFKYVNDTHGHAVGDELLIAIAGRLRKLVRRVDTLARIGGDEFAVILSEFHETKNIAELSSRLLTVLGQPVDVEGRELRVTGSLGVAIYPAGVAKAKDLLRQADLALYKAKNSGGNCARFFAREMDREVQRGLALARDLDGAVERGELFLEYQLQVALATGAIVGVEALLRWKHPTKGLVEPERFIPIAESTGKIRAIGRWVIRSACAHARRWQVSAGRGVRVSVNLSPVQCRDSRFVATILEALKDNALAPDLLDLEVNEKLLKQLPHDMEDSLKRLGDFGVGLTLDNFGSGSSALEHFQRFRFDRLKIHQSLVRTIGQESVSASVASGIVALARKMNVQIVAEGIERPEELEALLAEGCDVGQGFLFGRPLSADAISGIMSLSGDFLSYAPEAGEPALGSLALAAALRARLREAAAEPGVEEASGRRSDEQSRQPIGPPAAGPPAARPPTRDDRPAARAAAGRPVRPARTAAIRAEPQARPALPRLGSQGASAAAARVRRRFRTALSRAALVACCLVVLPGKTPQSTAFETDATAGEAAGGVAALELAAAQPEEPAPAPPVQAAQEPEDPAQQAVDLAQSWARAWSEQRVDDYLRLYAADFRPPGGMDRGGWEALRRARILKPRRIEVKLSAVAVEVVGAGRARVSFDQSYRSESHRDTVRKTLELVREDGGWRILAERADG